MNNETKPVDYLEKWPAIITALASNRDLAGIMCATVKANHPLTEGQAKDVAAALMSVGDKMETVTRMLADFRIINKQDGIV